MANFPLFSRAFCEVIPNNPKFLLKKPFEVKKPEEILRVFGQKKARNARKKQGFFYLSNPSILGKKIKNAQKKQGKSQNEKARKTKKARIGGSWHYRGAPCVDTVFLGITDIFPLKEGSTP